RLVGLIDQRRDMADVHRLMQGDELARLAQAGGEIKEILLHRGAPGGGNRLLAEVVRGPSLSYLDRHRTTIQKDGTVNGNKTMKDLLLSKHGELGEVQGV